MEPLVYGLVAVGYATHLVLRWMRRQHAMAWRRAAEACGLTDLKESRSAILGWPNGVEGVWGTCRVRLESYGRTDNRGTRVVIDGLPLGAEELVLRRESPGTAMQKKLGATEVEIGDEAFDEEVYVQGPPTLVRAILGPETRRRVRSLLIVASEITVSGGFLRMDVPDGSRLSLLASALRSLLDVAERMVRPDDVAQRLAENARADPFPAVRLQNLLTLVREYSEHPATGEALRAALKDDSDEIRLRAAIALGEEGTGALLELAGGGTLATGWTADDSCSARAVAALGKRLPRERAEALLGDALRGRRPQTACACVGVLGRFGSEAVKKLASVLLTERGDLAAEAARAIGATGAPAAERPLLEALARGLPELRAPVAQALGHVGSSKAVLPLKEAEARNPDDRDLRRASRQAVAEIQSRLTGASPGQLSLAEGQAGQLSLAQDERGRLSLKDPDPSPSGGSPA